MTKIAQCNKCRIGEGIHCEYYNPTEDSDCSHFALGIDRSKESKTVTLLKWSWYVSLVVCWIIGAYMEKWAFAYIGGVGLFLTAYLLYIIVLLLKKSFKRYPYMETRKLIIDTLKSLGCQPEVDKEDESIHFMYQGEHFFIVIEDNAVFTIYDTWWGTLNLDDSNIQNLKEAINMTNMNATPVTLYSTDEDKNVLGVHSRYRMSFTKEIPKKDILLKTVLDSFFSVHQEVKGRFATLNDVQLENKKEDRIRIKGFA